MEVTRSYLASIEALDGALPHANAGSRMPLLVDITFVRLIFWGRRMTHVYRPNGLVHFEAQRDLAALIHELIGMRIPHQPGHSSGFTSSGKIIEKVEI